jgi:WD40 repeat protein
LNSFRQVWWCQAFDSLVDVVAYSPDGQHLAVAGHDRFIDIYHKRSAASAGSITQSANDAAGSCSYGMMSSSDWARGVRCMGHSSAVKHLDWSVDGSCLQSVDQAHEVNQNLLDPVRQPMTLLLLVQPDVKESVDTDVEALLLTIERQMVSIMHAGYGTRCCT